LEPQAEIRPGATVTFVNTNNQRSQDRRIAVENNGDFRFGNVNRNGRITVSATIFNRYPNAQREINNRPVVSWKVDNCHLSAVGENNVILYRVPFASQRDEERLRAKNDRGIYPACNIEVKFGELHVSLNNAIYWKLTLT